MTTPRETPLENPYSQSGCFFCGQDNPVGLKLRFARVEGKEELVCRWRPDRRYLGLGRVLHGGIQCGLFDEIMGWTAHHFSQGPGVTQEVSVRYLAPLFIDRPLELRCRVVERKERRIFMEAEIRDHQGRVCSRARGSYALMDPERFARLVQDQPEPPPAE